MKSRRLFLKYIITAISFSSFLAYIKSSYAVLNKNYTFGDNLFCKKTPKQIPGPYYRNLTLVRRHIIDSQEGIPLLIKFKVVDVSKNCKPVKNLCVNIWHCNSEGRYSGWDSINPDLEVMSDDIGSVPRTDEKNFLRGSQLTDSSGFVRFTTIYPGFYAGRATHIHFTITECLEKKEEVLVSQLYFPEDMNIKVYESKYYPIREINRINNKEDDYYKNMNGKKLVLNVKKLSNDINDGLYGEMTIYINSNEKSLTY